MSLPSLLVRDWQLAPGLDAAALLYAGLYLGASTRIPGWPRRRTAAFLAGVAVVLTALQSGYDGWDERLLSAHMVQHMLLLILAPALLLAGRPALLLLRALPPGRRPRAARTLAALRPASAPLGCLALFSAIVLGTHLPGFYDATLRHPVLHDAEHLLYLVAGTALWWPILGDDPLPSRRLGGLGMLLYLLVAMAPMALVGAYLNRAASLVYAPYAAPAHALGISALTDQAQAGAIMWVGGDVVMIAVGLWAILAAMLAEEQQLAAREARLGSLGGAR